MTALAKSQLTLKGFKVDDKALQRVVRASMQTEEGLQGIRLDQLYLLHSSMGVLRELERDARRRKAREAQQKLLASLRDRLARRVKALEGGTAGKELEEALQKLEHSVAPLLTKVATTSIRDMHQEAEDCEELISAGHLQAGAFRKKAECLPESFLKELEKELQKNSSFEAMKTDLEPLLAQHAKRLKLRVGRTGQRLERAQRLVELFREKIKRKEATELSEARQKVAALLQQRWHQKQAKQEKEQEQDPEMPLPVPGGSKQLFLEALGRAEKEEVEDEEASLSETCFVDFVSQLSEDPVLLELAPRVFRRALPADSEELSLKTWERLFFQRFFKVKQETPLTQDHRKKQLSCEHSVIFPGLQDATPTGANALRLLKPKELLEQLADVQAVKPAEPTDSKETKEGAEGDGQLAEQASQREIGKK